MTLCDAAFLQHFIKTNYYEQNNYRSILQDFARQEKTI